MAALSISSPSPFFCLRRRRVLAQPTTGPDTPHHPIAPPQQTLEPKILGRPWRRRRRMADGGGAARRPDGRCGAQVLRSSARRTSCRTSSPQGPTFSPIAIHSTPLLSFFLHLHIRSGIRRMLLLGTPHRRPRCWPPASPSPTLPWTEVCLLFNHDAFLYTLGSALATTPCVC